MAEASRPRAVEYYNPRPLLLGICFVWGIVVGFSLFYFAPPKQMGGPTPTPPPDEPAVVAVSPSDRRQENVPEILDVTPVTDVAVSQQPRMETLTIEPPVPALSTEGGLTGRTAQPLTSPSLRPSASSPAVRPPPPRMQAPPPMPELLP